MTNFAKVGIFMKNFGQEVKTSPSLSSEKINNLRISLIKEELDELSTAINSKSILYLSSNIFSIIGPGPHSETKES